MNATGSFLTPSDEEFPLGGDRRGGTLKTRALKRLPVAKATRPIWKKKKVKHESITHRKRSSIISYISGREAVKDDRSWHTNPQEICLLNRSGTNNRKLLSSRRN